MRTLMFPEPWIIKLIEVDIPKRGPNHSSHGAIWAVENWKGLSGKVLAYLIAGHHAGLPDWQSEIGGGGCLSKRLDPSEREDLPLLCEDWIKEATCNLRLPATPPCNKRIDLEIFHLWVRMLYSCLVDADFLNTEFFMKPEQSSSRSRQEGFEVLSDKFYGYMDDLIFGAEKTEINTLRQQIFKECQKAAEFEPGFFSLNVPTGGGKTLAGMVFALNHALKHDKKKLLLLFHSLQ